MKHELEETKEKNKIMSKLKSGEVKKATAKSNGWWSDYNSILE